MSKVIKGGGGTGTRGIALSTPVYDAKREAERVIAEARAAGDRIRLDAEGEAERIRTQAGAEGRERGLQAVTELLVAARLVAARTRNAAESDLRTLAVRIAEKILGRELTLQPDAVTDVVSAALRHAGEPRDILIRVAPEDLEALERGRPRLLERCKSAHAVTFRADDVVPRGGCVIETELGVVDARLATQLEAIDRALRGES